MRRGLAWPLASGTLRSPTHRVFLSVAVREANEVAHFAPLALRHLLAVEPVPLRRPAPAVAAVGDRPDSTKVDYWYWYA